MSVTVRHLNADTSFLFIFSPKQHPEPSDLLSSNGAFSVLIDPWVVGSSVISAKWFAVTDHTVPSSIKHLNELEEPDVVLVSQNKTDHCHKETLQQLRPEGKTIIAAEPGAAKTIKSWNYFDPHRVHSLLKYDAKARFGNNLRLRIPPLGPDGLPGELNIAFIPARNYVTGLHQAIGITYQAPTKVKAFAPMATIDLPRREFSILSTVSSVPNTSPGPMLSPDFRRPPSTRVRSRSASSLRPLTAPERVKGTQRHRPDLSRSSNTRSSEFLAPCDQSHITGLDDEPLRHITGVSRTSAVPKFNYETNPLINTTDFATTLPTPPVSPSVSSSATAFSPRPSDASEILLSPPSTSTSLSYSLPYSPSLVDLQARHSRPPVIRPPRPKAISILYTPHGVQLPDLQPYISNHLVPLPGALPLTCLLHSLDYVTNPWWFGGTIMLGQNNGVEIAKALMTRCWISAHDEDKNDRGVAVKLLKSNKTSIETVKKRLVQSSGRWDCDVRSLDVGAEICLSAETPRRKTSVYSEGVGLGVDVTGLQFREDG